MKGCKDVLILVAARIEYTGNSQRCASGRACYFDHIADMNSVPPRKEAADHTGGIIGIGSPSTGYFPPRPHPPDTGNNFLSGVQVYFIIEPCTGQADGLILSLIFNGHV